MTGDERPDRRQGESRDPKRRSRPLIVTGLVLLGVTPLLFGAIWWHMQPSSAEIVKEARPRAKLTPELTMGDTFKEARSYVAEVEWAEAQQREAKAEQREAAVTAMLVPTAAGVLCLVLACVPHFARLMAVGILLLGLTASSAAFMAAERYVIYWRLDRSENAALCGFVIAVIGLSGLVCAGLGLLRLLARRKGT